MPLDPVVFSRDTTCPKCGAGNPATRFLAKDCPCGITDPHLHLRCLACEYGAGWNDWAAQTMDSPAGLQLASAKAVAAGVIVVASDSTPV